MKIVPHAKENGNVLFLILIAVALFAALSYAITQSSRTSGSNGNKEQSVLNGIPLIDYGTAIQSAILRMKVSSACTDHQISFENSLLAGYTNPNAPSGKQCHVFDPSGGGMSMMKLNENLLDATYLANIRYGYPYFGNGNAIMYIGIQPPGGAGTDPGVDLVMFIPFLKREVCVSINNKLGVGATDAEPPWANDPTNRIGSNLFAGTYSYADIILVPEMRGKQSGCMKINNFSGGAGAAPNAYVYAHVLIAR